MSEKTLVLAVEEALLLTFLARRLSSYLTEGYCEERNAELRRGQERQGPVMITADNQPLTRERVLQIRKSVLAKLRALQSGEPS